MTDPISQSLERVAEIAGDPLPQVYARLFDQHPDMRDMFILDRDDAVKGQMLMQAIECIFDHLDEDRFATNFVASERVNHEGLGVPPEIFNIFFAILKETCAQILGADWTPETEASWAGLLLSLNVSETSGA